jgi:parallel beta-helix repeat protein
MKSWLFYHPWLWRGLVASLVLICMLVMSLPLAAASAARYEQPQQGGAENDDIPPGRPASWDVVDDPHAPLPSDGPGSWPERAAAAPTDCLGVPTRQIRYTSDGVIHLEGCGQLFTLTQVAADAHVGPSKLELVDAPNKIWLLKTKLRIEEGATLKVIGGPTGDANWLRLRSDPAGAIWLRGERGNLLLQDTKVTSWDTTHNSFDTDVSVAPDGTGGRAYIAVRSVLTKGRLTAAPTACHINGGSQEPYEARMDVVNSEVAYLGYNYAESYGIVWKVYYKVDTTDPSDQPPPGRQLYAMVDIFGEVNGSMFDHNYFGSYTFGAYCMNWSGNTFAQNIGYGFDGHDDSDYITLSGNSAHDNGNHGLICSVECNNLVITNNQSYGNEHGIMVHRNSNQALIEGNTVYNNRQDGIAIFDSYDAVIRNNTVTNNTISAVRLSVGSSGNLIENNKLTGLAASGTGSGYVIYTYKGSDVPTSGNGLPKNNIFRNNQLIGYKSAVLQINDATSNLFEANTIGGPLNIFAFNRSPGNTIRNSEVGKTIQVTLNTTSTVTLQDNRNDVWMFSRSGLSTAAGVTSATVNLNYANTGGSVAVTTLDLAVRPPNGTIAVQPTSWQAGSKSWTEHSNDTSGAIMHTVGGLQGSGCYDVMANGAAIGRFRAAGTGRITFLYTGGYSGTVAFVVTKAPACASAVPTYKALLPLVSQ